MIYLDDRLKFHLVKKLIEGRFRGEGVEKDTILDREIYKVKDSEKYIQRER